MPIITPESLHTAIKKGKIAPLYLLFGEEEFLISEAIEHLISVAVDESTRSFNFDMLHGAECTPNDVIERALAYPLMAERRVVVIKEIDRMFAGRSKPDASSHFGRYMASPSPTTTLIMTAPVGNIISRGKKGEGTKAPYDVITATGIGVHFKKIYDREIPSWASVRIKKLGKDITPDALEMFVGYAGSSLRVISNEIEKLLTFVEERKKIAIDDVRAVTGTSRNYNVFELQKAVGAKNMELSVEIAERMLRAGEPAQLILTMLTRYFTILWRLSEIRARTTDTGEMARTVGISPFFINEYVAALSKYPLSHIRNAFETLLSADIRMKSSNTSESILVQLLLVSIIQGENVAEFSRQN